ncbi:MAG: hypothetical protein ABR588_10360 [Sphingomicrobium sp.]
MLEGRSYVPLIYLRQSEMQGLENLPSATKSLIVPVVRIRPWLSSKSLSKSAERVQKAMGDRRFGFDLDDSKKGRGDSGAQLEFDELFEGADGWRRYYEHLLAIQNAVPVLRSKAAGEQLEVELGRVNALERGLFVRIEVGSQPPLRPILETISMMGVENVAYILDCGWRAHLLPYQAQCVSILRTLVNLSPNSEFVVAGGDFPQDGFDKKGKHFTIEGEERALVQAVRREINEAKVIFGDWASARPPKVDNEIRRNRPRIDLPTRVGWECWRLAIPGKSYQNIAQDACDSRGLGDSSDFWGNQMIIATAADAGAAQIRSPNVAAAVRINLHMLLQAHYDAGGGVQLGDELVSGEL